MVCLQMLPNFLGKRKLFSEKKGIRLKFTRKVHIYFIDNKYFHRAKQYLKKNVFFFISDLPFAERRGKMLRAYSWQPERGSLK